MNIEKKLEYFTEAITREMETKKRQARRQMTDDFNAEVISQTAQAEAEAAEQLAAEKQEIDRAHNRRITEASTESRRALSSLREKLTAGLFSDIAIEINAFTRSPEYEGFLIDSIKTAQTKSKHPYEYVQLTPADMHISTQIQIATNLTPEQGEASAIGGYKLLTANRSKAADHTFQSRLAEATQEFSAALSQKLSI